MNDRNIFAFTAPGSNFPEYVSINRRDEKIYITVRAPNGGATAEMRLPYDQLDEFDSCAAWGPPCQSVRQRGQNGATVISLILTDEQAV